MAKGTAAPKQSRADTPRRRSLGLSGRNRPKLSTIAEIRQEMGRIYRMTLQGKCEAEEATKLTFVLKEIRQCLETEQMTEIERQLALLMAHAQLEQQRDRTNGMKLINGHALQSDPA